jgi:hypothetical protein
MGLFSGRRMKKVTTQFSFSMEKKPYYDEGNQPQLESKEFHWVGLDELRGDLGNTSFDVGFSPAIKRVVKFFFKSRVGIQ